MAHDVFISHSNQDKTVASAMCTRLEQAGIRCWIAPRDVRPGRNWGSEIIRGLDNAKVMIVVLSASANRSRPVIKEVERAFGKDILIISVRTEEVEPSEALVERMLPQRRRARMGKSRMSFRGVYSGLRLMTPEIIAVRNARHRRGWPSSRRRDTIHRIGQLLKDLTTEMCSRQR